MTMLRGLTFKDNCMKVINMERVNNRRTTDFLSLALLSFVCYLYATNKINVEKEKQTAKEGQN